jgi:hypothetical protein
MSQSIAARCIFGCAVLLVDGRMGLYAARLYSCRRRAVIGLGTWIRRYPSSGSCSGVLGSPVETVSRMTGIQRWDNVPTVFVPLGNGLQSSILAPWLLPCCCVILDCFWGQCEAFDMDADVRIGWCTLIVGYGRNASKVIAGMALMVLRKAPAGYVYTISRKWAEICGITRLTSRCYLPYFVTTRSGR